MSTLLTSYCAVHTGSASAERVGQGEVCGVTRKGDMHMVAAVAICRNALVGTGWSNSCLVYPNRLWKHFFHIVEPSILAV